MIVGHTDSGKTACINILGKSLTALAEQSHLYPNKNYKHVKTHTLNPKALSMGELYGQVN